MQSLGIWVIFLPSLDKLEQLRRDGFGRNPRATPNMSRGQSFVCPYAFALTSERMADQIVRD